MKPPKPPKTRLIKEGGFGLNLFGSPRRIIAYLWIILIFSAVGSYLYFRGAQDGIAAYKHSKHFMMTLDSQYRFGYADGKASCE